MGWMLAIVGVGAAFAAAVVLLSWRRPELGIQDGRLRPCGERPNCVCSHAAAGDSAIAPLSLDGDAKTEFRRLKNIVSRMPGARLIEDGPDYLRFEFSTPIMHYVDDVEFLLDADSGIIHVRSASRVGYSDMGANRQRVEAIRERFEQPTGQGG